MGRLRFYPSPMAKNKFWISLKDFLAEEPVIEIAKPSNTWHILTFPSLELHLRKQTMR